MRDEIRGDGDVVYAPVKTARGKEHDAKRCILEHRAFVASIHKPVPVPYGLPLTMKLFVFCASWCPFSPALFSVASLVKKKYPSNVAVFVDGVFAHDDPFSRNDNALVYAKYGSFESMRRSLDLAFYPTIYIRLEEKVCFEWTGACTYTSLADLLSIIV